MVPSNRYWESLKERGGNQGAEGSEAFEACFDVFSDVRLKAHPSCGSH